MRNRLRKYLKKRRRRLRLKNEAEKTTNPDEVIQLIFNSYSIF